MPEIILDHVTKRFGEAIAVNDVSIVIDDQSFISLLGPSGCGKTTILRMIAGLETPTEGEIVIDGRIVFSSKKGIVVSPADRGVGFLFQNYALWPHMTVYQNIAFGLENLKINRDTIKSKVKDLMKTLKISEFETRYPAELSGGQQQRVAIARTLAIDSKVLLMDEPLSNLDAKLRNEMRMELKRLHTETDSTFIYVTHDQLEAMTLSTKICLLKNGLLQQYEAPLDTYNKPENLFVADFMGNPSFNFIDAKVNRVDGKIFVHVDRLTFEFIRAEDDMTLTDSQEMIMGIRCEAIRIAENGAIEGRVYSSLPSGMETIVRIDIGNVSVTSVIFGAVDYKANQKIRVDFISNGIVLFDKETTKRKMMGSLRLVA